MSGAAMHGVKIARWKVWLALALIFLSGAVCGGIATRVTIQRKIDRFHRMASDAPEDRQAQMLDRLERRLNLSAEQRLSVGRELAATYRQLRELRSRNLPEAQKIIEDGSKRIEQHLDSEQRQRFSRHVERMHERLQHEPARRGPGPNFERGSRRPMYDNLGEGPAGRRERRRFPGD